MKTEEISRPARLAAAGEGITAEELGLAARNHGMPLESLRYDLTPPGLHYLLIHYDIPAMDPAAWRLRIGGLVERDLELSLDDLASMPSRTVRVTMECAGNGRARLEPRPVSQPWLVEAVGTADWTGVPLADLLDQAGVAPAAVEAVFTGADHGFERGVEQDYQRSLTVADARHPEVLVAYAMNGQPLPPQHGFPARLIVPGWYGMAQVKWLTGDRAGGSAVRGIPADRLRVPPAAGRAGHTGDPDPAAGPADPAGQSPTSCPGLASCTAGR